MIDFFIFSKDPRSVSPPVTVQSILVVEDDAIVALMNYELLTKAGYTVPQMFASGEDLLDHLECSELPDLILMDIGLDGKIDGIETARRVRERYNVPVIFLSSYVDDQRRMWAKEISPYRYVVKPVIENQLMETIGDALGKNMPGGEKGRSSRSCSPVVVENRPRALTRFFRSSSIRDFPDFVLFSE
jgi:CheY-like chemotaxis protein